MENYIVVFDGEEEIELDLQEDHKSLSIETIKAQCGPKATGLYYINEETSRKRGKNFLTEI